MKNLIYNIYLYITCKVFYVYALHVYFHLTSPTAFANVVGQSTNGERLWQEPMKKN